MDITDLILTQHQEQRRTFGYLDELHDADAETLGAVWKRLEVLLEVHAEAEEKYFYPRLLAVGQGASDADSAPDEVKDAVKDHNEIRDAIRKVRTHEAGSGPWWDAVKQARVANSDHMAEEEREDLADFRLHADLATRHAIAVQFLAYEALHASGIPLKNDDPDEYVAKHG